jgi:hypothetical protein
MKDTIRYIPLLEFSRQQYEDFLKEFISNRAPCFSES